MDAEIPAPVSGVLTAIKAETGTTVQVNSVVAVIGAAGSGSGGRSCFGPGGRGECAPRTGARDREALSGRGGSQLSAGTQTGSEHNVDLRQVSGSGSGGRITKDDILSFVERAKTAPPAPPAAVQPVAAAPAAAAPKPFAGTPGEVEPMSVMRKKIAEHMIASRRTSAHVHTVFDVDMTRIVRLREKNKARFQESTGLKLTYTPFFIRAVAQGLRAWPIMNASVEGDNIHYKRDINIGIAVALDWGLLVPVIQARRRAELCGTAAGAERSGRARAQQETEAGGSLGRYVHHYQSREFSAQASGCRSSISRRSQSSTSAQS